MYAEHVPIIAAYMRETPAGFMRGCLFAILSIRQPIRRVPAMLAQIDDGDLASLFGFKAAAYAYLMERAGDLHRDVLAAVTTAEALDILTRVPGLGVVKAAFVLQLMGFDVACLDGRNVKREGRKPRAFRSDGARKRTCPRAWQRKIALYLGETEGKAERYWDDWCAGVAAEYGMTAEAVSELHLAIVPENYIPF